jgi:hypothetical protein
MGEWTLFSNHGHVLVCLANNNQARLRDVAAEVGITERAVQNILRELQSSGLVQISKHGRCNHYQIDSRKPLRHPLEAHCTVGKLLQMLQIEPAEAAATESPAPVRRSPKSTPAGKAEPAQADAAQVVVAPPRAQPDESGALPKSERKAKVEKPQASPEQPTTKKTNPGKTDKPGNQQGNLF